MLDAAYKHLPVEKNCNHIQYDAIFAKSIVNGALSYKYIDLKASVEELNYEILSYLLAV